MLESGKPYFSVPKHSALLLAAYMVPFPYSGEAMGVLAGVIDMNIFMQNAINQIGPNHGMRLLNEGTAIVQYPADAKAAYFAVRQSMLDAAIVQLRADALANLELEIYSINLDWILPVLHRAAIYLVLAGIFGFLVWRMTGKVARSLPAGSTNSLRPAQKSPKASHCECWRTARRTKSAC